MKDFEVGNVLKSQVNGMEFEIVEEREEETINGKSVVFVLKELVSKQLYFVPFGRLIHSKFEVLKNARS